MNVRKWLSALAFLGLVLIACPVSGLEPQEVLVQKGVRVGSVQCRVDAIGTIVKSEDKMWTVVLMAKTGKIVMIEEDSEGNEVRVVFGKVWLAGNELRLEILFTMSAEKAAARFPHPCDFLAPREA